uniref:Uncharacterized protein n=1 Tax=Zea mays TaxID=4577 RepID=A0A804QND5_MAIZE
MPTGNGGWCAGLRSRAADLTGLEMGNLRGGGGGSSARARDMGACKPQRQDPDEDTEAEAKLVVKKAGQFVLECNKIGDDCLLTGCSFSRDASMLTTRVENQEDAVMDLFMCLIHVSIFFCRMAGDAFDGANIIF